MHVRDTINEVPLVIGEHQNLHIRSLHLHIITCTCTCETQKGSLVKYADQNLRVHVQDTKGVISQVCSSELARARARDNVKQLIKYAHQNLHVHVRDTKVVISLVC